MLLLFLGIGTHLGKKKKKHLTEDQCNAVVASSLSTIQASSVFSRLLNLHV